MWRHRNHLHQRSVHSSIVDSGPERGLHNLHSLHPCKRGRSQVPVHRRPHLRNQPRRQREHCEPAHKPCDQVRRLRSSGLETQTRGFSPPPFFCSTNPFIIAPHHFENWPRDAHGIRGSCGLFSPENGAVGFLDLSLGRPKGEDSIFMKKGMVLPPLLSAQDCYVFLEYRRILLQSADSYGYKRESEARKILYV